MSAVEEQFRERLGKKLAEFGFVHSGTIEPLQKVRDISPKAIIDKWTWAGLDFYTSSGCSGFCDEGSRYRDEYIMHGFCCEAGITEILSYAMFFHGTLRSLQPADLLEVGKLKCCHARYSHILVAVPQFLPGSVNYFSVGNLECWLGWFMPVLSCEADYIKRNNVEIFETKLNGSTYDFFDERPDCRYLQEERKTSAKTGSRIKKDPE